MTADPLERNAERQPRVDAELRRAAFNQLLRGGPFAETLHVLLVLVVYLLINLLVDLLHRVLHAEP